MFYRVGRRPWRDDRRWTKTRRPVWKATLSRWIRLRGALVGKATLRVSAAPLQKIMQRMHFMNHYRHPTRSTARGRSVGCITLPIKSRGTLPLTCAEFLDPSPCGEVPTPRQGHLSDPSSAPAPTLTRAVFRVQLHSNALTAHRTALLSRLLWRRTCDSAAAIVCLS